MVVSFLYLRRLAHTGLFRLEQAAPTRRRPSEEPELLATQDYALQRDAMDSN